MMRDWLCVTAILGLGLVLGYALGRWHAEPRVPDDSEALPADVRAFFEARKAYKHRSVP